MPSCTPCPHRSPSLSLSLSLNICPDSSISEFRPRKQALEHDLLDKKSLAMVNAYQPALTSTWMFQKSMSVGVGEKVRYFGPHFFRRIYFSRPASPVTDNPSTRVVSRRLGW